MNKADKKKLAGVKKWIKKKGDFSLTELVVQCNGWTCECCGSGDNLDAFHLNTHTGKDADGYTVVDSRNENLICLCPLCYKQYNGNAVEALRHMTNPQIFKDSESDPRLKKYC